MRVIVIGAGVVGASVAYRLAQGGAAVSVLERDRVGGGTSGSSFAWTNSNNKTPRAYHDLNVAGMRAHAALRDEFGATPWWHDGGSIEWESAADHSAQREKIERLRAWGYRAEWITPRDLAALEPDLDRRAIGDAPIAYFPDEGWLDPVPYAHAMLTAAQGHGAILTCGLAVTELVSRAGRIVGVSTHDGALHEADMVVNCAGRWADMIGPDDARLPLAPTIGFLAVTPPVASSLSRVLRNPICHMRPDGAGRLLLHRDETDALLTEPGDPGPASPEAHDLVARAVRLLPGIGPVLPEATRLAIRPIPRDGLSAIGQMPGMEGCYAAVSHSGVTLSPYLGMAVADEILNGTDRPELAPFRPARLFN
jgi:glycine/D-amino acid oxidase-like deaminating enzyme